MYCEVFIDTDHWSRTDLTVVFLLNKSVVMSLRPSVAPLFWVKGTTYHSHHIESVYCLGKRWLWSILAIKVAANENMQLTCHHTVVCFEQTSIFFEELTFGCILCKKNMQSLVVWLSMLLCTGFVDTREQKCWFLFRHWMPLLAPCGLSFISAN